MSAGLTRAELPRFARVAGGWRGLRAAGVEADGVLRLLRVPDEGIAWGPELGPPDPVAPGGVAIAATGGGFVADPAGRLLRVTPCEPLPQEPGLLGVATVDAELSPGLFLGPRGLCFGPRGRVYVADAASVLVVDPATGAVTGNWPASAPWQVVAHGEHLYVLDRGGPSGTGRITRFSPDGVADPAFAPQGLVDPQRIAVDADGLAVLDRGPEHDSVRLLEDTGAVTRTWRPVRGDPGGGQPPVAVPRVAGLALLGARLHLADADRHDLLTFSRDGTLVGVTQPAVPIADLLATDGSLWSFPLAGGAWRRHDQAGRSVRSGVFVTGPLDTGTSTARREVRARFSRGAGEHVRLWTAVLPDGVVPGPDTVPTRSTAGADWVGWSPLPADVEAALLPGPTGPALWLAGELSGDGSGSPTVSQLAVTGAESWLDLLPAIYRRPDHADFLDRLLRLLGGVQVETDTAREGLVAWFDAWAAPDRPGGPGPLDDLAAWVLADLDEGWEEAARRAEVARAHPSQALRGTPRGLADAIEARFGVRPVISHPAQQASVWALPADDAAGARLGFTTMVAAAAPDGAIVGATATLDHSHLTAGVRPGAPLYADLAHRFVVRVPASAVAGREAELRALVDAHAPAHTSYSLCLAAPTSRLGIGSRLDDLLRVGGPAAPLTLGEPPEPGAALAGHTPKLGGEHLT